MDQLYFIKELNIILDINQIIFWSDFENELNKIITLHIVAAKVRTNNMVAVSFSNKKPYSPKF